jgi:hypothetical protein
VEGEHESEQAHQIEGTRKYTGGGEERVSIQAEKDIAKARGDELSRECCQHDHRVLVRNVLEDIPVYQRESQSERDRPERGDGQQKRQNG